MKLFTWKYGKIRQNIKKSDRRVNPDIYVIESISWEMDSIYAFFKKYAHEIISYTREKKPFSRETIFVSRDMKYIRAQIEKFMREIDIITRVNEFISRETGSISRMIFPKSACFLSVPHLPFTGSKTIPD
jgi:hypothetical protein